MAATPPNDQKGIGTVDLADFETEAAELDIETGLDVIAHPADFGMADFRLA
jgi:hypothetical protein